MKEFNNKKTKEHNKLFVGDGYAQYQYQGCSDDGMVAVCVCTYPDS